MCLRTRLQSISHAPRLALSFTLLAASLTVPCRAADAHGPIPRNGTDRIGTKRGWNVFLPAPCADTLAATPLEVVPAIRRCLRADAWRIQRADPKTGEIVTAWKRIQHPLARLLLGNVEARCAVNVTPLDSNRTVVLFQGGIASRENVEGSPMLAFAERAYRNAERDWANEVRTDISYWRLFQTRRW